jgi:hypothetical protein
MAVFGWVTDAKFVRINTYAVFYNMYFISCPPAQFLSPDSTLYFMKEKNMVTFFLLRLYGANPYINS